MLEVTAAIIFTQNKLLIARRTQNKHLGGFWEFPGGKIENGESPEKCLKREMQEELGLNVKVGDLFMSNAHKYDEMEILLSAYFCEIISGEIVLNAHDKIEFINIDQFDSFIFAPADIPFINKLKLLQYA